MDIFKPATGEVVSSEPDDIACWFIDTDYSGESFFVRHAYFPGAEVPYKALRNTLKAEIDEEAWDSPQAHRLAPVREAQERADRGEGDQSSGG